MKIALISDIHSNLYYLEATLGMIRKERVDEIYCLGDLVGYYDSPAGVIDACMANNIKAVRGNHEHYLLGSLEYDREKELSYRVREQKETLSEKHLEFLASLPDFLHVTVMGKEFYLTHSRPGNCTNYLYDIRELEESFISRYDYFCFGHTHRPLINYHFGCCILNPGSVGQPRDYTRRPSFVVVDIENDTVKLMKLNVDYASYSQNLKQGGYNELNLNALQRTPYEKDQRARDWDRWRR